MKQDSLKKRLIEKFGEGFYKYIFKDSVEGIFYDVIDERFYFERYNKFYYRRKSRKQNTVVNKFRKRKYSYAVWSRVYKEYGEIVLEKYNTSDEYLKMSEEKRKMFRDVMK